MKPLCSSLSAYPRCRSCMRYKAGTCFVCFLLKYRSPEKCRMVALKRFDIWMEVMEMPRFGFGCWLLLLQSLQCTHRNRKEF